MNRYNVFVLVMYGIGAIMVLTHWLVDFAIVGFVGYIVLLLGHISSLVSALRKIKSRQDKEQEEHS